jgi:maleate isomerase
MYGWRGRIGLLTPHDNTTMECEITKIVPEGVSVHTSRMECHPGISIDELRSLSYEKAIEIVFPIAEEATRLVSSAGVDVIVYGTTDMSHLKGKKWNEDLTNQLEKISKRKIVTASTAVEEGLRELEMKRISLVTPYTIETTNMEIEWLESLGFDVVHYSIHHLEDQQSNIHRGKVHPELLYLTAKKIFKSNVDGVFISCTNLRTFEIIEIIEKDFGKPVVTSNQACLWAALQKLNIKEPIINYGNLLKSLSEYD